MPSSDHRTQLHGREAKKLHIFVHGAPALKVVEEEHLVRRRRAVYDLMAKLVQPLQPLAREAVRGVAEFVWFRLADLEEAVELSQQVLSRECASKLAKRA